MNPHDPHDSYHVQPRSDVPPTLPRDLPRNDDTSTAWLPLLLVVALLIGAGVYYVSNTSDTDAIFGTPAATKQSPQGSSVTKSPPTPN